MSGKLRDNMHVVQQSRKYFIELPSCKRRMFRREEIFSDVIKGIFPDMNKDTAWD